MTPAEKMQHLDERALELRRQVEQHRTLFSGVGISDELKQAVLVYSNDAVAAGMLRIRIAEKLRLCRAKLRAWHREAEEAARAGRVDPLPVVLAPPEGELTGDTRPVCGRESQPVLVSPGGWRIEGLALPDLLALLQTLP